MKNRRFTTKAANDGDENETTISVNNNHVELTLVRWYYRFPLRDFGAGNKTDDQLRPTNACHEWGHI